MLEIGSRYTEEVSFSQHQVDLFIEISGDKNPIHVSDEAAREAGFRKKVVHGMLAGVVFGGVLGTQFPGLGSIVLDRKFIFIRPVYVDDVYFMHFKVADVDHTEHIGTLKCRLSDQIGRICVDCETRIRNLKAF